MKNILVIEDNSGVAELICDTLNEMGYSTTVAPDGKKAIEELARAKADMVILDYSLPDMDGKQIIAALEKAGIKMPSFIVSTGRGDEQLAVDMMKLGAYDYLIKDKTLINRLPEVVSKLGNDLAREKELIEAQRALEESEERFRNLVEKASDFFVKLTPDALVVYASPNWQNNMGFSEPDLKSLSVLELMHKDDKESFRSHIDYIAGEENRNFTAEFRVFDAQGQLKLHAVKGYSVIEKGQIFINCIARDVTEEKMVEKRLAKAVFKAEEEEKKKFAEKLHEDIGPLVSAIKMAMGRLKSMPGFSQTEISVIENCDALVDQAVTKVRNLANDLRPNILNDFGLVKAVRSYVSKFETSHRVNIDFQVSEDMIQPDSTVSIVLYRSIASLISFSVKNYKVSAIKLQMHSRDNDIILTYVAHTDGVKNELDDNIIETHFANLQKRISSIQGSL
ncbi:MAG: response regulator, partial [Bacteroidota bacterium]